MSPRLFNVYAEEIIKNDKLEKIGFKINGKVINNISYADDRVIIAETEEQMQRMLDIINKEGKKYGMKINTEKTKIMKFSKSISSDVKVKIDNKIIKQVTEFKYLGAIFTNDGRDVKEIKSRIGLAKRAFINLGQILKNRKMALELRKRIIRCYVWSVLKYAAESWTMNAEIEKRLNAFEMWTYRRLLKIPWTDFVSNKNVLHRCKVDKLTIVQDIKEKKGKYIGHKLREEGIFMLAVQGKIIGKATRGRKRMEYVTTNMGITDTYKIINAARSRKI